MSTAADMTVEQYRLYLYSLHSDLGAAIDYNSAPSERVEALLAHIDGENDGPNWHWIVKLADGRYAYLTGGCDYTGWDCQSGLDIFEEPTVEAVLRQVGDAERPALAAQIGAAT